MSNLSCLTGRAGRSRNRSGGSARTTRRIELRLGNIQKSEHIGPILLYHLEMARNLIFPAILLLCFPTFAKRNQKAPGWPDQFLIGRHTFMDFGPPHNFYEIFIVRTTQGGASVEKLTVTPAGLNCIQPEQVETVSARLNESVASLLGKNPCAIPEKELHRELKRCKHCLVYSFVNVAMQVQCGNQLRNIRADILDKDMFDPSPKTPPNTSWTMRRNVWINQPALACGINQCLHCRANRREEYRIPPICAIWEKENTTLYLQMHRINHLRFIELLKILSESLPGFRC
jgi:hypothetical protein